MVVPLRCGAERTSAAGPSQHGPVWMPSFPQSSHARGTDLHHLRTGGAVGRQGTSRSQGRRDGLHSHGRNSWHLQSLSGQTDLHGHSLSGSSGGAGDRGFLQPGAVGLDAKGVSSDHMSLSTLRSLLVLLLSPFLLHAASPPQAGPTISLFDGHTLTGWEGNTNLWRVQ